MFSIDMRSREPIHTQLEKSIVKYINLGAYEKDSALPSVRALACELGINPNTVSKAYKNLEHQGVIYTVAGKGVFVSDVQALTLADPLALDAVQGLNDFQQTAVALLVHQLIDICLAFLRIGDGKDLHGRQAVNEMFCFVPTGHGLHFACKLLILHRDIDHGSFLE